MQVLLGVDGHVLGPVVGEDSLDVWQAPNEVDVGQEHAESEYTFDQVAGFVRGYEAIQGTDGEKGCNEEQTNANAQGDGQHGRHAQTGQLFALFLQGYVGGAAQGLDPDYQGFDEDDDTAH